MIPSADDLLDRIREAFRNGEPRLQEVLTRWRGHEFVVCVNGKWRLEGFVTFFKAVQEMMAVVDGALPPGLPPHCLDPVQIARSFCLPLDAFDRSGVPVGDEYTLRRIEDKLDAALNVRQVSDYVDIKSASKITGLSKSHIRRAVWSGELWASNVGATQRPTYRIARTDLVAWMEKKKGGTINVPPKSDLDDLIQRHLPGLRGRKDSATR